MVELHVVDGDTPTLRLDQDGSSGFTPQVWDVAGNETNFFVRDVTNGSRLPLRIRPSAPTSSIDIAADGDVGIGTISPQGKFHVENTPGNDTDDFVVSASGSVGIGTVNPGQMLDVQGGDINTSGNYRLKSNIVIAENASDVILFGTGSTADSLQFRAGGSTRLTIATNGDATFTGNVSKGGGAFKIDHPLDPSNKYLYHSFVESPDMMNIYNGNTKLDKNGQGLVEMPDWFAALNSDFRYQLTAVGAAAPDLHVAEEINDNNQFRIAGAKPNMQVSWQVTGVRKDPFAQQNRIPLEVDKPQHERGFFLHPEAYGQPLTKGVNFASDPVAAIE